MTMRKSILLCIFTVMFVLAAMVCIRGNASDINLDDDKVAIKNSGSTSYPSDPKKGSISLDLQVDEDSSVYTQTVMVELKKLNAAEVEPFVRKSLSKYGSVSTNAAANILVITDREPKLSNLVGFVEKMDRMNIKDFVQLKTEVIYLDNVQASNIVSIVSERLSGEGTVQADNNLNVLVVTDVEGKIDYVKNIIKQLDRPPQQVIIEAKIVQVYDTDFSDVGIDLSAMLNSGFLENSSGFFNNAYKDGKLQFWTNRVQLRNDVNEIINTMVGGGKAKLIAAPRIVTVNNKQGTIRTSEQYYRSYRSYDEDYSYSNTYSGINLQVTPHIGAGNIITLDFEASEGNLPLPSPQSSNITLPTSSNYHAVESTIVVREGETFVVGGLDREYMTKVHRKTPILGDIPLIKEVFTKRVKQKNTTQIVFFLTPRILKEQANAPTTEEKALTAPEVEE